MKHYQRFISRSGILTLFANCSKKNNSNLKQRLIAPYTPVLKTQIQCFACKTHLYPSKTNDEARRFPKRITRRKIFRKYFSNFSRLIAKKGGYSGMNGYKNSLWKSTRPKKYQDVEAPSTSEPARTEIESTIEPELPTPIRIETVNSLGK